jgi:hypothetical protein
MALDEVVMVMVVVENGKDTVVRGIGCGTQVTTLASNRSTGLRLLGTRGGARGGWGDCYQLCGTSTTWSWEGALRLEMRERVRARD